MSTPDPAGEAALERARGVATLLDTAVEIPVVNYRVGLDPILGILPVAGDTVAAALSLYVVFEAVRAGVPLRTVAVMVTLVGIDYVCGSVPVLGTLFDAVWKANVWNVRLFERHVDG